MRLIRPTPTVSGAVFCGCVLQRLSSALLKTFLFFILTLYAKSQQGWNNRVFLCFFCAVAPKKKETQIVVAVSNTPRVLKYIFTPEDFGLGAPEKVDLAGCFALILKSARRFRTFPPNLKVGDKLNLPPFILPHFYPPFVFKPALNSVSIKFVSRERQE